MSKHAYLIVAHNNFYILEKLIKLLDYENNDIYIHIDKKVKDFDFNRFEKLTSKSKLFFANERFSAVWGGHNMIFSNLDLIKQAMNQNDYEYFHLLSGVDLPIKSAKDIYEFFHNSRKEFVDFGTLNFDQRYKYYYFFQQMEGYRNSELLKVFERISLKAQKIMKVNRLKMEVKYGSNWYSITGEFAKYLIENEKIVRDMVSYTSCADEMYVQTMLYNSHFKNNVYVQEGLESTYNNRANLRLVDWERGNPYTFTKNDFNELINSPFMFARKFDENQKEIVDMIYDYLIKQ